MVVYSYTDSLKKITEFSILIEQLNDFAVNELWDDMLLLWPRYELLSRELPQLEWTRFSISERLLLEEQIVKMDIAHSRLMELTVAWRNELQDILQSTVQSRKLNDHYR